MYYGEPEYEKAVEDCTAALSIDKMHVRSLTRRGTAYEKMGKFKEALKGASEAWITYFLKLRALPRSRRCTIYLAKGRSSSRAECGTRISETDERVGARTPEGQFKRMLFITAHVVFQVRQERLPASSFVEAYFGAFRPCKLSGF